MYYPNTLRQRDS